ncbi:hypothetical protein LTR36_005775 [Oleoguttula mirabilis]|uniref:NADH-cytochrome b5 reductase 2 n=1 Tax=Oleoguttula mirabilis TaxID=1507867 RepID=A0AAV9JDI8_9PEZI|nr:hypothetical protein LTR36_005775 [Oleoguttula mirabilis]
MAAFFSRALAPRTLAASTAIVGAAGVTYYATRRPILLDSAQNAPSKTLSFPTGMLFAKQLTVTDVEQVNHDTKRITFSLPGGSSEVSGVPASAAILTQHTPSGRWFPVLRPYTPIHDRDQPGILQLLVKKYPHGAASSYMHTLTPGSKLTVRGPLPGYTWTPSPTPRDVVFVAGGAGITPIFSLTKGVLSNADDKTRINLLWGVNGSRDMVLKDELASLQKQHPERLRVSYFISGSEADAWAPTSQEVRQKGYVDRAALEKVVQQCETGSFGDEKGTKVFFCGPPGMQESIAGKKGVLEQLGVVKKQIHIF